MFNEFIPSNDNNYKQETHMDLVITQLLQDLKNLKTLFSILRQSVRLFR